MEMMDMIIQIMVEVLTILGIATKEMKQSRISKSFSMCMSPVTERMSREVWKEADREDGHRRCIAETRQAHA